MYSVVLELTTYPLCEVRLKSITQVCRFLETVDFNLVTVHILSPKGHVINVIDLMEVWNA